MKRRPKTLKISRPMAALLVVAYAIYLVQVVHALLTILSAAWSSGDAVVIAGAVVVTIAGPVALVWSANRSGQPPTKAAQLR